MVWTIEQVCEKLGDKAQVTARGIIVVEINEGSLPKHILVAEFGVGDSFTVTAEGRAFLEGDEEAEAKDKPQKAKPAKVKAAAKEDEAVAGLSLGV